MSLTITNTSGGTLSLDYTFDERRSLRVLLPPDGTRDVGDLATLDELYRNSGFAADLAAGRVSLTVDADDAPPPDAPLDVLDADTGLLQPVHLWVAVAAGAGGSPDDVTLVDSLPFAGVVMDCEFIVTTGVGTDTVTYRDTAGGAGTALSSALGAGTADSRSRTELGAAPALAQGDSIYARRSDDGIAGIAHLIIARTAA